MKPAERDQIRRRLVYERERAIRSLDKLTARAQERGFGDTSPWMAPYEASDEARDAAEQETSVLLASKESRYLSRIEDALARLERDPESFGYCHRCGEEIPHARLDALPHVRYCLSCKQREEAGGYP